MSAPNTWRCFHCDEVFTDPRQAQRHFGTTWNAEAGCIEKLKGGGERGLQFALRLAQQEIVKLTAEAHEDHYGFMQKIAEYLEVEIQQFKPFKACRTLRDVFNRFDEEQGLALVGAELAERKDEVVQLIIQYGQIDGEHHKSWVLDQVMRKLLDDQYAETVRVACDGEDGPHTYSWNVGIAP